MARTIVAPFPALLLLVVVGPAAGRAASAQTPPVVLLRGSDPLPGAPGRTTANVFKLSANRVGGYAACVVSDGTGGPQTHIWGSVTASPGTVLRTDDAIPTSAEFGLSDSGMLALARSIQMVPPFGLFSIFVDDTPIALVQTPSPVPGYFWCGASGPGSTANGEPFFHSTLSMTPDNCLAAVRGIFVGSVPVPLYLQGDSIPGFSDPIRTVPPLTSLFQVSADGSHHIAIFDLAVDFGPDERAIAMDGAALEIDGVGVRENNGVPAAAGGLPGELWGRFQRCGVTSSGSYYFTAPNKIGSTTTSVLVVDGQIVLRQGDVVDGVPLALFAEAAAMNDDGDVAVKWTTSSQGDGAILLNGSIQVENFDEVDLDGDGIAEPGTSVRGIAERDIEVGAREPNGTVPVYFTADVLAPGDQLRFALVSTRTPVAECYLVLGDAPGSTTFRPWRHTFTPQLDTVNESWAVTLQRGPEIPLPGPAKSSFAGRPGTHPYEPIVLTAQVLMWNPFVFPNQPEQWTAPLLVIVFPNGQIASQTYGNGTGMQLGVERVRDADGHWVLRFPFTIPGF